jgi:hypothetical protein
MCAVLNGLAIILGIIVGCTLKMYDLIYAPLLFIPFGFIYILLNEKFSILVLSFKNNKSFSRFMFFFFISFIKYIILLIPLIVTCATLKLNIFNLYMMLAETIGFCLSIGVVSLIKFKK